MDPRQPPPHQAHPPPFSRNAASPYAHHHPFQAPPNAQSPYPTAASHPPPPNPPYADHQRRPSDTIIGGPAQPPYYQSRPGPIPPTASHPHSHSHPHQRQHPHQQHHPHQHQRNQSTSSLPSISSVPPLNRATMPPPGSPPQQLAPHQQQQQQQQPQQQQQQQALPPLPPQQPPTPVQQGQYGLPQPRNLPPVSVGGHSSFGPTGRDLPGLSSIHRNPGPPPNSSASMSIASMLGGGGGGGGQPPAPPHSQPQYASPAATAPGPSGPPTYASSSVHASPRVQPSAVDYGPSRFRPHTPDVGRPYDPRDPRDPRAMTATSPHQQLMHSQSTPEVPRYGTPQTSLYGRGPPNGPPDQYRDPRMPATSLPPRPSSQPKSFPTAPRPMLGLGPPPEHVFRRDEPPMKYNPERPIEAFDERMMMERERQERERHMEMRERDRRERTLSVSEGRPMQPASYQQYQPDPRDMRDMSMRDMRDVRDIRDPRDPRDPRDMRVPPRDMRDMRDPRDLQDPREAMMRDPRDPRDPRNLRDPRDVRDVRDPRDIPRDPHDPRDPREVDMRDPREAASWRPPYEQRLPYDPAGPPHPRDPRDPRASEYPPGPPPGGAPPYSQHPQHPQPHERYPQGPQPNHGPPPPSGQTRPSPGQPFESPERSRMILHHPHQSQQQMQPQQQPQPQPQPQLHVQSQQQPPQHHAMRPIIQERLPPPSVAYGPDPYDRPDLQAPSALAAQSRNHLQIDVNRKGRVSPLPQAVQGVLPQLQGPAAEPGIKSEFGRIFSGLGAAVSSPITSGAQLSFPSNPARRDDETQPEPEPKPAGGRGKRRKGAKDDEAKGDDDSTGRLTPVNHWAKRPKTHPNHHYHHHHPNALDSPSRAAKSLAALGNHHHGIDQASFPQIPFKGVGAKGSTPGPSPMTKEFPASHTHQLTRPRVPPSPVLLPKVKKDISSTAVLESVANRPRSHLGDFIYAPNLKPAKHYDPDHPGPSRYGYVSTPNALPIDKIRDQYNCTLTVKVSRAHLSRSALEEITKRCSLWGTEVYSDDSDVVAACVHGGWVRGAWPNDPDLDMMDIGAGPEETPELLEHPLKEGPVVIPQDLDMHVKILILPELEKYSSTTRFGINSREWGGTYNGRTTKHDGISFMVMSVRFTSGAQPASRLRGEARRQRMRKAMREISMSRSIELSTGNIQAPAVGKGGVGEGSKENRADGARSGKGVVVNGVSAAGV